MTKRIFKVSAFTVGGLVVAAVILWLCELGIIRFPCLFYQVTGVYCPGCGMTRAILAFCHGQFEEAFHCNMLLYLLLPFFLIYGLCFIYRYVKEGRFLLVQELYPPKCLFTGAIVIALFGVLRNFPNFSFFRPI